MHPGLRETILSSLSGVIFAIGWWIWIDANVFLSTVNKIDPVQIQFEYYIPSLGGTLALLMINAVSWQDIHDSGFWGNGPRAKIWLLASFVVAFLSVIGSLWVAIAIWFSPPASHNQPLSLYPGFAIIIQNVLIFVAALLYRFAKPLIDEYGEPLNTTGEES